MSVLNEKGVKGACGEWRSHALTCAFGTNFLFGPILAVNSLGLQFFFNYPRTIQIVLLQPKADLLVWIVSATCLSSLMIRSWKGSQVTTWISLLTIALSATLLLTAQHSLIFALNIYAVLALTALEFVSLFRNSRSAEAMPPRLLIARTLTYLLAYLAVIEISSATHYVVRSFDRTTKIGLMDAGIELNLSYVTYGLIPWLYVAFLFSWAWVPLVQRLASPMLRRSIEASSHCRASVDASSSSRFSVLLDPRLFVVLALAVFIGYYPYFQNPPWLVGTDAYWRYYDPLMRMNSRGASVGFVQALEERHPVPLALLYAAQLLFQTTAFDVVRFTPLFLGIAFSFSIWWFLARRKSVGFGLLVFVFSALSVVVTVGFYSSTIANWIALVVWVLFSAYAAYRADEKLRRVDFLLLFGLSTFILLIHPWTWGVFAVGILVAAAIVLIEERGAGLRTAGPFIFMIALDAALAVIGVQLMAGSQVQGWRSAELLDIYTFVLRNPSSILYFWGALTRLTQIWSPFLSPLLLAVSILGVFRLNASGLTPWRRRLVLAWLCASALGSLLVAPYGFDPARPTQSQSELWRVFFLTPFAVTAPLGVTWLAQFPVSGWVEAGGGLRRNGATTIAAVWLAIILGIGVALSLAPAAARIILLLISVPAVTALLLSRAGRSESALLSSIIMILFVLVAANSSMRSLSQLLLDPHNYLE